MWPRVATLVLALVANAVVQVAVRQTDVAIPDTLGAAAAALVFILAFRPVDARGDTSAAGSTR